MRFGSDPWLEPCLRGRALRDDHPHQRPIESPASSRILAASAADPVWTVGRSSAGELVHRVAVSPIQPDHAEPLRRQLRPGRFLSLLPLVSFLRAVVVGADWDFPGLRAILIVDDPNLQRPTYGFIDYRALGADAREVGYHVGIATIPIDAWLARGAAVAAFGDFGDSLSLLIHGNDHLRHELGRLESRERARVILGQALRRIGRLEQRTGLAVDRVMTAPHERCSQVAKAAMLDLGYEALMIDEAHPWRFRPAAERPTAGWNPAELVTGGLPVVRREHLRVAGDDLVFRAFLRQPLVLYGHSEDFSDGFGRVHRAVETINGLGPVRWCSAETISRSNYMQRLEGSTLRVRSFSRLATLDIPRGVTHARVELARTAGAEGSTVKLGGASGVLTALAGTLASDELAVEPGPTELVITPPSGPGGWSGTRRSLPARAFARRAVAQLRDRVGPTTSKRPPAVSRRSSAATRSDDRSARAPASPRAATSRALPNLLIIGAAKCGTTSLHAYLDQHPDVFMARPGPDSRGEKEMRFFWRDDWYERLDWYQEQFDPRARVRGEATPSYAHYPYLRDVPRRIHSLVPDARFIYIVRDPIERIVAHWVQARADGERMLARKRARRL